MSSASPTHHTPFLSSKRLWQNLIWEGVVVETFRIVRFARMSLYRYGDLSPGHLRVVKILLSENTTSITCAIQHFPLDSPSCPHLTAISYAWGEPSLSYEVFIDSKSLITTRSVYELLQHQPTGSPGAIVTSSAHGRTLCLR